MNTSIAPLPATESAVTLARVRQARDAGQLAECLRLAAACVHQAEIEMNHEAGYHALASAGRLHQGRSEHEEALIYFSEANRWAKGYRLYDWIAPSYHDLFLAYLEAERKKEGWRAFSMALELYGDRNPYTACLTADASLCELRRERGVRLTYDAYRGAHGYTPHYTGRLCAEVNMAEAASYFSRHLFERTWTPLYEEMRNASNGECVTRLLISAAESAKRMDRMDESRELALRAKGFARERGEGTNEQRADLLI